MKTALAVRLLTETTANERNKLSFCVRKGNRRYLITMTVFKFTHQKPFINLSLDNSMKPLVSRTQAQDKIHLFFKSTSFLPKDLKKIKRLAMKYHLPLKNYKKLFCKSCLNPLKGKTRISKEYKRIECNVCNYKNKWRIK